MFPSGLLIQVYYRHRVPLTTPTPHQHHHRLKRHRLKPLLSYYFDCRWYWLQRGLIKHEFKFTSLKTKSKSCKIKSTSWEIKSKSWSNKTTSWIVNIRVKREWCEFKILDLSYNKFFFHCLANAALKPLNIRFWKIFSTIWHWKNIFDLKCTIIMPLMWDNVTETKCNISGRVWL